MDNTNQFNIPVGYDEEEPEMNVKQVLALAESYRSKEEYYAAYLCYKRAAGTSTKGQLEYGKYVMEIPFDKKMSWKDRYRLAEKILLPLSEIENKSRAVDASVLLSTLYTRCQKKLSAFGYLLRAHNLAGTVDELEVEGIAREIEKMSINEGITDPHGAYIVGMELSRLTSKILRERAAYLLQLAVENGKPSYAGIAALRLAELLEEDQLRGAVKYLEVAALHGYPDTVV